MSEIRDKVRGDIAVVICALIDNKIDDFQKKFPTADIFKLAEQILSVIPELAKGLEAIEKGYNAKVDRKAKLPKIFTNNAEEPKSILRYREELANYVLEIK